MTKRSGKTFNYFAYGSNTEPQDFKVKTGLELPEHYRIGALGDRRLAFTYRSRSREGGVLDVVPCQGSLVEGVVYSVNEEVMEAIREKEGAPYIERQEWVYLSSGERVWAHFFEVRQHLRRDYVQPSRRYLGIVLKGYRRCGVRRDLLRAAARNKSAETSIDPRLFTYGTLMRGQSRHDILKAIAEPEYWKAEIFGTLHSFGEYPALTIDEQFPAILVQGELHRLKVRQNLFDTLDQVEGALPQTSQASGYYRTPVTFGLPDRQRIRNGWAYVWWGDLPPNACRLRGGDWRTVGQPKWPRLLH